MKFLFIGNGATSNRGCEAILLSTIALLENKYPGSTYINASNRDPRVKHLDYMQIKGLKHRIHPEPVSWNMLTWQFYKRVLGHECAFERYINNSDYIFALGGDNYTLDYNNPELYFRANDLVLKRNKPIVMWGCSVGPFSERPEFETYVAKELKKVYKIVARETETQSYLHSIGVHENVILRPDPAFFLEPRACQLPTEIDLFLQQGCIGLNLSPLLARYRNDHWPEVASQWLEELLKETDLPILLIPHVMQPGNNDYDFMKTLYDRASRPERLALVSGEFSSQEYKDIISKLKVFVGARTHATIAALSTGTPTISVGYSLKAKGINKDLFGHLNWLTDHQTLTAKSFAGKVKELLASECSVRNQLADILPKYIRCTLDFL